MPSPEEPHCTFAFLQGGQLVIYGCLSGKSPVWPWQSWVFRALQVQGFNFRAWMAKNAGKVGSMMEALGGLMKADQLRIAITEYAPLCRLAAPLQGFAFMQSLASLTAVVMMLRCSACLGSRPGFRHMEHGKWPPCLLAPCSLQCVFPL